MTFQTDLNQRERQKYAESLIKIADAAREVATALVAEDDPKATLHFVILNLVAEGVVTELRTLFMGALEVAKATEELEKETGPE